MSAKKQQRLLMNQERLHTQMKDKALWEPTIPVPTKVCANTSLGDNGSGPDIKRNKQTMNFTLEETLSRNDAWKSLPDDDDLLSLRNQWRGHIAVFWGSFTATSGKDRSWGIWYNLISVFNRLFRLDGSPGLQGQELSQWCIFFVSKGKLF